MIQPEICGLQSLVSLQLKKHIEAEEAAAKTRDCREPGVGERDRGGTEQSPSSPEEEEESSREKHQLRRESEAVKKPAAMGWAFNRPSIPGNSLGLSLKEN